MSTPETTEPADNRWIYWGIAVILVALAIFGLIAYDAQQDNEEAQAKARQLTQKLEQAGYPVPADIDMIVNTLGEDGGAVCDNPADALGKAILADQLTNGASFVGRRPVIADNRFVAGEALILETYCPEKLEEFREDVVEDYKFDDTVED
jgi:hypothetical protein